MPVCESCLNAAQRPDERFCSQCARPAKLYETGYVVLHKVPGAEVGRPPCTGSFERPITGHEYCEQHGGCPCQHRPPGSWKGGKT